MQKIDNLPLWLFFLIVLTLSLLWTECGYHIGEYLRTSHSQPTSSPLALVLSSVLSLLSFMLGFTFNIAVNRFDDRRAAILSEATAISTTYSRADFFADPQRGQIKKLLRQYVQLRAHVVLPDALIGQVVAQSEAIQIELWSLAAALGKEHQSPVCALFISSLNEVIDAHAKRVALGLHSRVPLPVWYILFAVLALSMAGVGFYSGLTGSRSWAETIILIVTFTLVMLLVVDLDRPIKGLIKTGQHPMLHLAQKLGPP